MPWVLSVLGLLILLLAGDALVKGAVNLSLRLGGQRARDCVGKRGGVEYRQYPLGAWDTCVAGDDAQFGMQYS